MAQSFTTSSPKFDLAKVTLLGRLGNDPVLRTVSYTGLMNWQNTVADVERPLQESHTTRQLHCPPEHPETS